MKYMILTYASQQDYDAMAGKPTEKSVWSAADFAAMGAFMESFNRDLVESGELVRLGVHDRVARCLCDSPHQSVAIVEVQVELALRCVCTRAYVVERGVCDSALGDQLLSPAARDLLIAERFTVVLWNVVPRDWERPRAWVDIALEACRQTEHAVLVVHDLPGGAMAQLPSFLDRAVDEGAHFSADFPPSCVVLCPASSSSCAARGRRRGSWSRFPSSS